MNLAKTDKSIDSRKKQKCYILSYQRTILPNRNGHFLFFLNKKMLYSQRVNLKVKQMNLAQTDKSIDSMRKQKCYILSYQRTILPNKSGNVLVFFKQENFHFCQVKLFFDKIIYNIFVSSCCQQICLFLLSSSISLSGPDSATLKLTMPAPKKKHLSSKCSLHISFCVMLASA